MAKSTRLNIGDKIYFQGNPYYKKGIYLGCHDIGNKRYAEVKVKGDHIIDVESFDINQNSRPRKISTDPLDMDSCINYGISMMMTDAEIAELDCMLAGVK